MARKRKDEGTLKDGRTPPIFIHSIIDDMIGLTPNTMRVYMHLARRADKSGAAWPSYQSIGDHCFGSVYKNAESRRRHAMESIDELINAQLVRKEMRFNELGFQSNHYVLLDPPTTTLVIPGSLPSDPPITTLVIEDALPSDPGITTLVIPGSLKDSPVEDLPIEDTPLEEGIVGATPTPPVAAEWLAYLAALCWVCYGHQKTEALTVEQMGALTAEAKKIRDLGYSKEDLREWWKQVWRNDWRWDKGRQRPRPDEVRSSIPILRAAHEVDDAANGSYLPANYEPLQMGSRLQEMAAEREHAQLARRQLVEQLHAPNAQLLAFWQMVQTDVRLTMTPDHYRLIADASVLWMDEATVAVAIWDREIYRDLLHPNATLPLARAMSSLAKRKLNLQVEFLDSETEEAQ
jgi:hypothetical protein